MPVARAKNADKNAATALASKLCRHKAGACIACGETEKLQACHVISRRYSHTRTIQANLVAGCASCHQYWGADPATFVVDLVENVFNGSYKDFKRRSKHLRHVASNRAALDWAAERDRVELECWLHDRDWALSVIRKATSKRFLKDPPTILP